MAEEEKELFIKKVKPINKQTSKSTSKQTNKQTNQQASKQTNKLPDTSVLLPRYTTYLPKDIILKVKQEALKTDKKSYQIVYDALVKYFANK